MGLEISQSSYSFDDFCNFKNQLQKETLLLKNWLKSGSLSDSGHSFGVELEGWLLDKNNLPSPINDWFLKRLNNPSVVSELSKYNFEINGSPFHASANTFSKIRKELEQLINASEICAKDFDSKLLFCGTLPSLEQSMLNLPMITNSNRYKALNAELIKSLDGVSKVNITGSDSLKFQNDHILSASAATSFQFQWKVPVSESLRVYNASLITSSVIVGISGNSPYAFGKSLWEETRVPLFEHSISSSPSRFLKRKKNRAFFASGYVKRSIFEVFCENLENHEVLLPALSKQSLDKLYHLTLHNGTVWRWNRPVIGFNADNGTPHIRFEHRSLPAGPTLTDSMANMMFFIGLTYELSQQILPPETLLPFALVEKNFYRAAKNGLSSKISWLNRTKFKLEDLVINQLLEQSKIGLEKLGISDDEIKSNLEIIRDRVLSKQTGSQWQRKFMTKHNSDAKALTEQMYLNQQSQLPVHLWKI